MLSSVKHFINDKLATDYALTLSKEVMSTTIFAPVRYQGVACSQNKLAILQKQNAPTTIAYMRLVVL